MTLITQKEALKEAYEKYTNDLTRPAGLYGLQTGLYDLDLAIGGFIPGKVTTLAGKSKHGKSAVITQVMRAGSLPNPDNYYGYYIFFSWEQSVTDNIERYVCHELGITLSQYRYAKILPDYVQDEILKCYSKAKNFKIKYHQTSTDIDTVLKIVQEELKVMKGLEIAEGVRYHPVVIVDYVSMAKGRSKGYGSKTNDIGDFMQTFKQFANVNKVSGLFLAQILRTAEGEPTLAHVLDSANYENNSDNAIILYRPEADLIREIRDPMTDQTVESTDRYMLRVLKARDGHAQDILGHCNVKYFRFWHRHHKWGYNYQELYKQEEFWRNQYGV